MTAHRSAHRWWIGALLAAAALTPACGSDESTDAALSVTIAEPVEGTVITGPITVIVDVDPTHEDVTVFLGNTATLAGRDGGRLTFDWTPPSGAGETTITARATNERTGGSANAVVHVQYLPEYAPVLTVCETLCRPAAEVIEGVGTVRVAIEVARYLRGDLATAIWTIDDVPIPAGVEYPFEAVIDTTTLADGDHALAFEFTPELGTGGSASATLHVANCDGDGDGFERADCGGTDCNDRDIAVYPGAAEACDGLSNDCDAEVDEGATCEGGQVCLLGACRPGVCASQGQPCVDESQDEWPYRCDVASGTCRQLCAMDHPIPERACPSGRSCRPADGLPTGEGLCVLPECTGEVADECDDTDVCVPYDFGFGECGPDGTAGEGEACRVPTRDDAVLVDPCSAGTECFAGACRATCDPTAPDCGSGLACVRIWDSTREVAEGACLRPCDSFGTAGCLEGSSCQPVADFAFSRTPSWACVPALDGPIAERGSCTPGEDTCVGGTHCIDPAGPSGTDPRCLRACDTADPETDCGEGRRCAPTLGGVRGTCVEECDPFPRAGTGNYGCASDTATCHPLVGPGGACVEDATVTEVGDPCGAESAFGVCPDDGYCVDLAIAGTSPVCHRLCDPFADDSGCAEDEVCNARPLLDGQGAIGVCDTAPNAGEVGDACAVPGHSCAADGTLCIDTGDGPTCRRTCAGPVDCDEARCLWTAPLRGLIIRGQAGVCEL